MDRNGRGTDREVEGGAQQRPDEKAIARNEPRRCRFDALILDDVVQPEIRPENMSGD
jgi:hypothetical protein